MTCNSSGLYIDHCGFFFTFNGYVGAIDGIQDTCDTFFSFKSTHHLLSTHISRELDKLAR